MVYRLACPSCQKATEHPFVRPGAVAVCADCRTVWRIEKDHITRSIPSAGAAAKPGDADAVSLSEAESGPRPSATHGSRAGDTAIVGLSGLSEVMRSGAVPGRTNPHEPALLETTGGVAAGKAASSAGVAGSGRGTGAASATAPTNPAQRRALEAARRRRRRTLLVLFMALTVMVGTLGVAVALMASREPPDGEGADGGTEVELADPNADLPPPLRPARLLGLDDERFDRAVRSDVHAVADAGERPELVTVRLIAAEDDPPPPFNLIITARTQAGIVHAWAASETRALTRAHGLRFIARLPDPPDPAEFPAWTVTVTADE